MSGRVLKIHPQDNVLVALSDLQQGQSIQYEGKTYQLLSAVNTKHKFAITDFKPGDTIIMYGLVVGRASKPIREGEVVTTDNIIHDASNYEIRESHYQWSKPDASPFKNKTFMGYHRSDGQVGTRNYWIVVPLVFCENRNVEYLKNAFLKKLGYAAVNKYESLVDQLIQTYKTSGMVSIANSDGSSREYSSSQRLFEHVDGIKFLTHSGGCGGTRQDAENLCRLIAGYIHNPNVAGATILSLGCQHAQIDILKKYLEVLEPASIKPVLYFEQQKFPSEEKLLQEAILQTFTGLTEINKIKRAPAPLSKLTVGLKCGGSDGFSGITANPAMGYVSDILSVLGGKSILAEFPELCGVEQNIVDRCTDINLAKKFSHLMKTYNDKAEADGSGFSMNPSPGNIKDGLLTDAMKSAGAAKKGGTAPVNGVLDYSEYIHTSGLNLLCTPGNDVEATTGMAGSGANVIIFSTGLGTPTGNPVAPVIKTSTNSILKQRITDIIDFDHGDIITQQKSIEQSGSELLEHIIKVASGEFTKAEQLQQDDFIPWKQGVSL